MAPIKKNVTKLAYFFIRASTPGGKSIGDKLTCDEISVVELAHRIRLEPGDFVTEVAIEDGETILRQRPGVADVYLKEEETGRKHSGEILRFIRGGSLELILWFFFSTRGGGLVFCGWTMWSVGGGGELDRRIYEDKIVNC